MSDGCKFTSGEVVSATSDPRFLDGSSDCVFEVGATILLMGEKVTSTQRQTQSSGAVKKEVKKMPAPTSEITSSPQASSEQQVATEATSVVSSTGDAAPVQSGDEHLQTQTEVPSGPSADEIAKAASMAGDNPALALGLAMLVVVGGGGAMWKFIQQRGKASAELDQKRSDQEHELRMKELDLKSQDSGPDYSSSQPPPCQAATIKQDQAILGVSGRVSDFQDEIDQLKTRMGRLEKKSVSISADFDADEINDMVKKHEKDIKALKAAARER